MLHSSNELGKLSQWQCRDDSTVNVSICIIIIIVVLLIIQLAVGAGGRDILSVGVVSAFTRVAIDNVSWYLVIFTRPSAAPSTPSLQRMQSDSLPADISFVLVKLCTVFSVSFTLRWENF